MRADAQRRLDGLEGAGARSCWRDCPFYRLGYFPARTHGWDATMAEYDRKSEVYEYGYQRRPPGAASPPAGRVARPRGRQPRPARQHGDRRRAGTGLKARAPENDLVYLKEFFPGYRGGVVGQRVPPLRPRPGRRRPGGRGRGLREPRGGAGRRRCASKDAGRPGVAVVPMASPYVYLGGRLTAQGRPPLRRRPGRAVSLSTNNGRTFTAALEADRLGTQEATVDLKDRSSAAMPTG